MMDLHGKKLLILGGNAPSIDIVEAAKAMGVYTIVTDWYDTSRSPAKLVANEYWNEEVFKPERIAALIKKHHIDGVLTGFTDSYLLQYQKICELSGLPCYATKKVFETTMNKATFKALCRKNGVPVIPEYDLETFDPRLVSDQDRVIIKPVDNSGSRGVILCARPEDFQKCLNYALSFSEKKQVVIEKYMEMDNITVSYVIQEGKISLSTINDRYVHKAPNGSAVTCTSVYPSQYIHSYLTQMNDRVCSMFRSVGVKNGIISMQFFTDGREFFVVEMGHRLTGGQHYFITKVENGASSLDQLIHFSITGSMADFSIDQQCNAQFDHVYCHLYILGRQARIARIEGLDYLRGLPGLLHLSQMKSVGDLIGPDGTAAQKVLGVHLKMNNRDELESILHNIQRMVHFYDEDGNDLTINLME